MLKKKDSSAVLLYSSCAFLHPVYMKHNVTSTRLYCTCKVMFRFVHCTSSLNRRLVKLMNCVEYCDHPLTSTLLPSEIKSELPWLITPSCERIFRYGKREEGNSIPIPKCFSAALCVPASEGNRQKQKMSDQECKKDEGQVCRCEPQKK